MLRHVSTASGKKKLNFEAKSSAPPTFLFLQPRMERNIATVKRNKGILGFREIFNSRRIRGFVSQHWKVRRVEGNFGVKLHVDHLKREWISLLFSRILLHSRIRSNEYSKYQNSLKSNDSVPSYRFNSHDSSSFPIIIQSNSRPRRNLALEQGGDRSKMVSNSPLRISVTSSSKSLPVEERLPPGHQPSYVSGRSVTCRLLSRWLRGAPFCSRLCARHFSLRACYETAEVTNVSPRTSPNEMLREIPPGIDIETEYPPRIFSSFLSFQRNWLEQDICFPLFSNFAPLRAKERSYFLYIYIFCKMQI